MKIGIISDTHGNTAVTRKAVAVFKEHHIRAVFHAGDIGSFEVLQELSALSVPVHAVLGNVDRYNNDWKYQSAGFAELHGRFGDIPFDSRRIALIHSDDRAAFNDTVSCGTYDFVFSGHTHAVHDYMERKNHCINPGSAGRGSPNSCAVLNLKTGQLKIHHL